MRINIEPMVVRDKPALILKPNEPKLTSCPVIVRSLIGKVLEVKNPDLHKTGQCKCGRKISSHTERCMKQPKRDEKCGCDLCHL